MLTEACVEKQGKKYVVKVKSGNYSLTLGPYRFKLYAKWVAFWEDGWLA